MSQNAQNETNRTFKITKGLIEDFHKKGYTVKEMADNITNLSGIKCSVGTVNRAAEVYKIDMRTKPRKNGFVFEDPETPRAESPAEDPQSQQEEKEELIEEKTPAYQF